MQKFSLIALIGPPNVGKSTLSNYLVGEKISIVSPKVQTTRSTIKAIFVEDKTQLVFLDTPGIFIPKKNRVLERSIVKSAWQSIKDSDEVCLLIDAKKGVNGQIKAIIEDLRFHKINPIIIINKIDLTKKAKLLILISDLTNEGLENIFMISALSGDGVEPLKKHLLEVAKIKPWLFSGEEITDAPLKFLASEITREKLFLALKEDLPYNIHIENDSWQNLDNGDIKIYQTIYVLKDSQKSIIIGKRGSLIKQIGHDARVDIAKLAGVKKVHLFLIVKVKNWLDSPLYAKK